MPGKMSQKRNWAYGTSAIVSTLVLVGILVFVALISNRHPWRVDLTDSKKFTLSEQTKKILDTVKEPIHIKGFFASAGPEQPQAQDLLEMYHYRNKNITFDFVDPDRQPEMARSYEIRSYGTLVLEGYKKKQTVQMADEENITNAIFKLTRNEEKKIYFLIGHGEHSLKDLDKEGYSNLRSALEKENYKVEEANLMQSQQVPKDAALLVIAGPQKTLFKEEIASLKTYLDGGGHLLVLVDPFQDGGLRDFLKSYGAELRDDIVIDKLSRVFGGSYLMPVVTQYGMSEITKNFDVATFYPEARSVSPVEKAPANIHATALASTSQESWAETNLDLLKQGQASFDEKEDRAGPVPLAVLSEISPKADAAAQPQGGAKKAQAAAADEAKKDSRKGLLVVFGNSKFVDNTHFALSGNGDLMLNALNYLAEEKSLITVEAHQKKGRPLILSRPQAQMIFWTSVVFVPLSILLAGLGVYRVRRGQR